MPVALLEQPATIEDSTRREFIGGAFALSAAALLLAGCGGDDAAGGATTRTVQDAFGPTEVPGTPTRVVADAVSTYAHLVSLGLVPVAVAFPVGISPEYVGADTSAIANVVAEDGWTVDVEEALALDPDLVVAVGADYNAENCGRYRAALPTFCFADVYTTGSVQDIKDTLTGIAGALGREEQAKAAIAAYDERVAALRARVAATDLAGTKVGIVRIDVTGFIGIRTGDAGNGTLEALGIGAPTWPDTANDGGYVELSLENLEVLDAAEVLLVNTDDDVVIEQSTVFQSSLWNRLDVVTAGRAHFVGAWNGSDLPQLQRMLDDIEEVLVVPAEAGR